jgi:hypothetical protein
MTSNKDMNDFRGNDAARLYYPGSLKIVKTCYNCKLTQNGATRTCLKFGFEWDVLWVCDFHQEVDND